MSDLDPITQLFGSYAWAMDANDFGLLGDVFARDASFSVAIDGGDTYGPFEGRDAIIEFISSTVGDQQDQRRHVITNHRQGDGAQVTAILTLNVIADGKLTVQSTGVYHTELVTEDGKERFAKMNLVLDLPF